MILEKRSNLVMPVHYIELDSDEMSYVVGGGYVSLDECNITASLFMTDFILYSAQVTLFGIIAGCNWWNPVGWAAAATAIACSAIAAIMLSNYYSAIAAMDTVNSCIRQGKSFRIYENVRGLVVTYTVES